MGASDERPEAQKKLSPAQWDTLQRWDQSARAGSISGQLSSGFALAFSDAAMRLFVRSILTGPEELRMPAVEQIVSWYLDQYLKGQVPDSEVRRRVDRLRES